MLYEEISMEKPIFQKCCWTASLFCQNWRGYLHIRHLHHSGYAHDAFIPSLACGSGCWRCLGTNKYPRKLRKRLIRIGILKVSNSMSKVDIRHVLCMQLWTSINFSELAAMKKSGFRWYLLHIFRIYESLTRNSNVLFQSWNIAELRSLPHLANFWCFIPFRSVAGLDLSKLEPHYTSMLGWQELESHRSWGSMKTNQSKNPVASLYSEF